MKKKILKTEYRQFTVINLTAMPSAPFYSQAQETASLSSKGELRNAVILSE
jgi:hypothetical protein